MICSMNISNSSQLILTCPNGTNLTELPFTIYDIPWLSNITSFLARGENNTRGPFISIPTNICWMSNLTTLNLTYNQLSDTLLSFHSLNCTVSWEIIDLSHNYLATFPSTLFSLTEFDSVYLNDNQLTAIDLSIVALVQETVDLRNNLIMSIINPTNFTISIDLFTGNTIILLDGNPMLPLNDGIYELYGSCEELREGLTATSDRLPLTLGIGNIDFGTTRIYCSCDQYYIIQMLNNAFGTPVLSSISTLLCSNAPINFVDYACPLGYSTVNFTQVQSRLCKFDGWNVTTMSTTSTSTTTSTPTTTSTSSTTSTATTISTSSTTSTKTTTSSTSSTTTTTTATKTSTSTTTSTKTTTSSTSSTTTTATATSTSSTTSTKTTTSSTSSTTATTTSTSTTTSTATTSSTSSTTTTTTTTATTTSTSSTTSTKTTTSSTSSTTTTATTTSTSTTTSTATTSSTSSTTTTTTATTTSTSTTTSTKTTTSTTATTTSTRTTTSTATTSSTSSTTTTATTTSTSSTTSTKTTTSSTSSTTTTTTTTATTTSTSTTTSTATTSSTSSTTTTTTTTTATTTSTSTTTSTATTSSTSSTTTTTTTTTATTTSTSTTTSTETTTTSTSSTTTTESTTSTSTTTSTGTTTTTTSSTTSTSSSTITSSITMTVSSTTIATTSISTVNISTCLATFSISNTDLLLTCPSNANLSLLPISDYGLTSLERITSLRIAGFNGARGPLQTIPANICFLTKLQVLNVSYNRLDHLDASFLFANPLCLETLQIFDMSNNYFSAFPSLFLTQSTDLRQLFLQNNQLTSFDLALFVLVSASINLSNNQISKITNTANVNISNYDYSLEPSIDLTNNSPILDLTDAIYEMYGACYEIYQIFNSSIPSIPSLLTIGFLNINFGISKINCTCDQYYLQRSFLYSIGNSLSSAYALSAALCTSGELFYNNNQTATCSGSSVNFLNTRPRLCQINANNGNIILVNTTDNITGIYPYYLTQTVNNSYCLFTFYIGGIRVSIDCINGSNALTEISSFILNNIHFLNITQVSINNQSSFSQLPAYLCFLPSMSIDLSNQSFRILDQNTFPCLINTTLQTINLAYNQINIVNLTLFNWILIDLTSNNLSQLPYTLFNSNSSTISSRQFLQRNLRLQLNQLTQLDLFVYTYVNTAIDLRNNPFLKTANGYHILNNYQKQSLRLGPISINVNLPTQMRFLLNDQLAQNYNTCDVQSLHYLLDILQRMKTDNITIEIQCDCSTIYIKEYFYLFNSSQKLTDRYSCSNTSSLTKTQFDSLTETDCLSNITLSPNRLCQFARIANPSLSSNPISTDNGRLLAIILGSVLGSLGFLLLLILIIVGVCYRRRSRVPATQISTISRAPYISNTRPEIHQSHDSLPSISQLDSTDISREETSYDPNRRRRRIKEPPIDYDTNSHFYPIDHPTQLSSRV